MAISDTFTTPAKRWISPAAHDVWGVDFENMLSEGETITTAAARIFATLTLTTVADAVVTAAVDGVTASQINVEWNASDLSPGVAYRMETIATIDTGAELVLYTDLVVV